MTSSAESFRLGLTLTPRVVRVNEGTVYLAGPESVRVVLPSAATGGVYHVVEVTIKASDFGPSYHVHSLEDETFMVMEGELVVIVKGVRHDLEAGDVIFAPRGVPHRFMSGPNGVRMSVVVTGDNLERFFCRVAGVVTSGESHRIPALAAEHGITLLPNP